MTKRILFVLSSANRTLVGTQTGWFLPEASHPYYHLEPKYDIDFASPKGPNPEVDEWSVEQYPADRGFLEDPKVKTLLETCKFISDVRASDYDAIFYVGGQGPVLDLASDLINAQLAAEFYRAGKPTTAVCHGPAALVLVTDAEGESIFKGKRATGFTNVEEDLLHTTKNIPFLVEDRLKELGAHFEKAPEPWLSKVVVDGNLITGQNPASAKGVGEELDKMLSA